ncbi:MAG: divergent polysaccharide deacetylase family protein [Pseudomonadales bacterium]|nr:divergent polysaccharide deacetylase family protein [Pseudomonadales bacterium]MDG1444122.1 divergent polysaccharide deacetylase family protein [Pseudomonadales bacterium]
MRLLLAAIPRSILWLGFMTSLCTLSNMALSNPPAYLAIIIDDLGHNLSNGERAVRLSSPVTYAVLPDSIHAKTISLLAHTSNKEVLVHLPMTNHSNHPDSPNTLNEQQAEHEFLEAIDRAIQQVPYAIGINNHMGSRLTQQRTQMTWLMQDLKKRDMFFIDSRTTPATVAEQVARETNLKAAHRDVFLDNIRNHEAISAAFASAVHIAKTQGSALVIAHPYPVTLQFLEETLPLMKDMGIEVIRTSELVAFQLSQTSATNTVAE